MAGPHFTTKRISNYEGFKRLDKKLEALAEGRLRGPRETPTDHLCPFCKCRKRSRELVPSRLLGVPARMLGEMKTAFTGTHVIACSDCARDLRRAGLR